MHHAPGSIAHGVFRPTILDGRRFLEAGPVQTIVEVRLLPAVDLVLEREFRKVEGWGLVFWP